jgi:hypothetical protein
MHVKLKLFQDHWFILAIRPKIKVADAGKPVVFWKIKKISWYLS